MQCGSCHHSLLWGQQGPGTRMLRSQEPQVHGHSCSPPSHREQLMVYSQDDTKELFRQCFAWKGVFVSSCDAERCRAVPPCAALVLWFLTPRGEQKRKEMSTAACQREETHCTQLKITYFCCEGVFSGLFEQFSCFQVMLFLGLYGKPGAC